MQYFRLNSFRGLDVVTDSPDAPQNSLAVAENILVRPAGAVRRMPNYARLWLLENLGRYIVGVPAGATNLELTASDGTVLVLLETENMRMIVAYDCASQKCLGSYFLGDSSGRLPQTSQLVGAQPVPGSGGLPPHITTGEGGLPSHITFNTGPMGEPLDNPLNSSQGGFEVTMSIIKKNLTAGKRWYFSRIYEELWMGNGVDPNLIWSNTRTPKTGTGYGGVGGQLREAGTNLTPIKPLVGSVASLPAAAAVQPRVSVITAGTTVLTVGTTTTTTGTSTLTFTADPINFSGTAGHNISVRIISAGTSTAISSTRTGAGTFISPFIYTLTIGTTAALSSADAIVNFVANDYDATGVLTASVATFGPDANPSLTLAQTPLTGGADEVTVGGHPPTMRVRFGATLYDPGPAGLGLGHEGPISALSEEVTGTGTNDFVVTVAARTGVPERFTKQNIWMRQYVGPTYPLNPDGPFVWRKVLTVENANGSYRLKKDFQTLEVSDEAPLQGLIPPCTMFEFAGDRMWGSGNAAEPYRIWLSKLKTETERTPEGCDISSYLDIEGKKEEPSRPRVTALRKLENRMQVHTDRSITLIEASTLNRIVSRSDFGAINPASLAAWNRPRIPYLGSDGVLYELNNSQWYRSEPSASNSWPVLRQNVNVQEISLNPQRCNMVADPTNDIVFLWMPIGNGTDLGCFAMDFAAGALTGPHVCPVLYSANPVAAGDARVVGADESGNLWVVDFGYLFNDKFAANADFTLRAAGYSVPQSEVGYPRHILTGGTSYDRSFKCVLETQMLDLKEPNTRKGFYTLEWSVARYTRAIVKVILTTDDGHTKTFECGEMYGRERNKIAFALSGNAIKVRFEAIVGEDKPFLLRDLTIGWENQSNAGGFFF